MTQDDDISLTRRSLLAACAAISLPRWMRAESTAAPILHWKLQEDGDFAVEAVSGARDPIASSTGHAIWAGQRRNRALRFDGYSVWLRHTAESGLRLGEAITVMAWVALEAYPVSEAAILQVDTESGTLFRFSIDCFGYLQCGRHPGNAETLCRSTGPIAKGKWFHLAATMSSRGVTLYRDGVPFGHLPNSIGKFGTSDGTSFVVGQSPDGPIIADVFPTGVLNGSLRDVQLFNSELSPGALKEIIDSTRPDGPPDLQINGPWCVDDPQRPICHAQPPRAWTNEPHGLIHWGGQYHLFYQKNPDGPYWSRLNWGHMTSTDLLSWTEMPVAITPELPYESKGCWSGSVIDHEGKLTLVYTAVDEVKAGISLAFSDDGVNFTKYAGNPVIPSPPKSADYLDFRDPFVWREGDVYYLIVGSGVKDVGGTTLLYRSKDLVGWEYLKQLYTGDKEISGPFFEMPIFLKHGDLHALVVSELPGRASYWVGSWKDEKFTPISSAPRHLELFNHLLSPTPWTEKDGQIVVMGIIPDERPAKEVWRAGWAHLYSLPRVLSIDENGAIVQKPHPSLDRLCKPLPSISEISLGDGLVHDLAGVEETSLHVRVSFKRGQSASVSLLLRRSPNGQEQTEILYNWEQKRIILDRTKSSLNPRVKRDRQEAEYPSAEQESIHFDVFVDRSVVEVFVDGRASCAARIYPTLEASAGIAFAAVGSGARVESVRLDRLEKRT
jgi:sucrose-6-phosphate hydrolase SacC (GH32 family)